MGRAVALRVGLAVAARAALAAAAAAGLLLDVRGLDLALTRAEGSGRAQVAARPAPRPEIGAARPRLLVLLVVDQLPRARLDPALPGGLGRLLREGRVFSDASLAHGITETCPGHAAISTGRHPGHAGIPANRVLDAGRPRYCVEGGSLAFLRGDTLADRVGAAGGRAVAISGKDRAALVLAGRAGLAVWLDPAAGFTARGPAPAWLTRFDAARGLAPFDPARVPEAWVHRGDDPRALPDDSPWEDGRHHRTSPHPVRGASLGETVPRLLASPFADALTLDLAREAAEAESLGEGPATDLLAVSLSATDYVGHLYGPDSQEILAALGALDAQVGGFLSALEARLGRGAILLALTADHGVTRNPELAGRLGLSECRAPGGRVPNAELGARIAALAREACRLPAAPEVATDGDVSFALPAEVWSACRAPRREAVEKVAAGLAAVPGVVQAWTAPDLASPRCAGACALFRASFDPERSGDWIVQLDPGCATFGGTTGASHGSPYLPDRAVPVVFWGGGVAPGAVRAPAHTIDVAPTLADRAGLPPWPGVDGRPLPLGEGQRATAP